jgi:hypothetical protein
MKNVTSKPEPFTFGNREVPMDCLQSFIRLAFAAPGLMVRCAKAGVSLLPGPVLAPDPTLCLATKNALSPQPQIDIASRENPRRASLNQSDL